VDLKKERRSKMYILHLLQVGQIYQFLAANWQELKPTITVKNGKEIVYDNIVVDSILKVNSIYKYLLENWANGKVQIFYSEPSIAP